nr:coiled-coil-helix-coiled-coil-helix domain-containing protein 10, mitochondrial-like [Dasypus novemcinctus]
MEKPWDSHDAGAHARASRRRVPRTSASRPAPAAARSAPPCALGPPPLAGSPGPRQALPLAGRGAAAGRCCWALLLGAAAGRCCWALLLGAAAGRCCWALLLGAAGPGTTRAPGREDAAPSSPTRSPEAPGPARTPEQQRGPCHCEITQFLGCAQNQGDLSEALKQPICKWISLIKKLKMKKRKVCS